MATTVTPIIDGQEVTSELTYCYLYEPLPVEIYAPNANKIFITLILDPIFDIESNYDTLNNYAVYDVDINDSRINIDLMEIARQHHNSNVYKKGNLSQITYDESIISPDPNATSNINYYSNVSRFTYTFRIFNDDDGTPTDIKKAPIIGARSFKEFTPVVGSNLTHTSEFQILGLDLTNRWKNYPVIEMTLADLADANLYPGYAPTITADIQTQGKQLCNGGFVIWKSKFGGWCYWGFELKTERKNHKYTGDIEVEQFNYSSNGLLNAYQATIPAINTDYTGVEYSYSYTLKSLGLTSDELQAVSGIKESPAVYFLYENGTLELMRLTSATVPLVSQANGGDFQITLRGITKAKQSTR